MCGDQVTITCHVEEKSTAALTTQGSTKVGKLTSAHVWRKLSLAFVCALSPRTRPRASLVLGRFSPSPPS